MDGRQPMNSALATAALRALVLPCVPGLLDATLRLLTRTQGLGRQVAHERVNAAGVELSAAVESELLARLFASERRPVWPIAGHRVVGIGDEDHAGGKRDLVP